MSHPKKRGVSAVETKNVDADHAQAQTVPVRELHELHRSIALSRLHPFQGPQGLSGPHKLKKSARPWKRKKPRDEVLEYRCYTGCLMLPSDWSVTVSQYSPPIVQPWDAVSYFYDWNEMCIPWLVHAGNAWEYNENNINASYCLYHHAMIPRFEEGKVPLHATAVNRMLRFDTQTDYLQLMTDWEVTSTRRAADINRLPVNGNYYHMHMVLEGMLQVTYPEGTDIKTESFWETDDGGPPCVRILAIQFVEEDTSLTNGNGVTLSWFWKELGTHDTFVQPWNYAQRFNHKDKEDLQTVHNPSYKILHDETVVLNGPNGLRNRLPFKLDFGPMLREYGVDVAYAEETSGAILPMLPATESASTNPHTNSQTGRILYGFYHNLKHNQMVSEGEPATLRRQTHPNIVWSGRWHFRVTDGNF